MSTEKVYKVVRKLDKGYGSVLLSETCPAFVRYYPLRWASARKELRDIGQDILVFSCEHIARTFAMSDWLTSESKQTRVINVVFESIAEDCRKIIEARKIYSIFGGEDLSLIIRDISSAILQEYVEEDFDYFPIHSLMASRVKLIKKVYEHEHNL